MDIFWILLISIKTIARTTVADEISNGKKKIRPRENLEEYHLSERREEKLATRITSQKRKRDKNDMEVIKGTASRRS